jgi:hypothetical protein
MYYLRTKSAVDAIAGLGIDMTKAKESLKRMEDVETESKKIDLGNMTSEELSKAAEDLTSGIVCSLDNPDDCEACGS